MRNKRLALCLAAALLPTAAIAALLVDQEQPSVESLAGGRVIGGFYDQKLAQTVTAGLEGRLTHVELPVRCISGSFIVEIVTLEGELPGTRVLASATVEAGALPTGSLPVPFTRIALDTAVRIFPGDRFAIVLRSETGDCTIASPPAGDTYPGGQSFYDALDDGGPRPRVWAPSRDSSGAITDLPFRTIVDVVEHGPQCSVQGLTDPVPIPRFVPLCRCLQDAQLREQRCTLLHPSLVLYRRLPFPLEPGEPFTVKWTLMPLAPLKGIVAVEDELSGVGKLPKAPLWFFADQMPPGDAMTLEYSAVAPADGGAFQLKTSITLADGARTPSTGLMRTMMPIVRARR